MKKYILGLTIAASTLSLAGCSDFLDTPVLGQQDLSEYFVNEDQCKQQITGCYQSIFWDDWWQVQKFYLCGDMCTDDMWVGNTGEDQGAYEDLAFFTGDAYGGGECSQNFWQYRYKGILRCNIAIERIPGVEFEDESLRDRYVAEAKFLRAYQYFDLVRYFGGVPLVLGMKMPSEIEGIQRASAAEVYTQIENDLKDAANVLPVKGEYASADLGRATKGAAQGLLAKAYLYQEKYEEAEDMLEQVMGLNGHASQGYDLLDDFGDVWSISHNNSVESLFEVQTNSDIAYNLGLRMPVVCGSRDDGGWAWGLPTSNLETAFKTAGDDIRLKWTIIKDKATSVPGDTHWSSTVPYSVSTDSHKSGRVTRKVYIPYAQRPEPYDASHNPLNYRILRYADVLLMYAEVENVLKDDGQARWALNKVRERVDLGPVESSGTELRDAIRQERRLELALENQRLFDIRRWKNDSGKSVMSDIMGPNGSGKSTLSAVLVGNPAFEVTKGSVTFCGKNLLDFSPEDRSHEGIFLSFQYPVEIPGVSMVNFMRAAVNEQRKYNHLPALSASEFLKLMREKRAIVELDNKLANRSVNEGFSGGEKKRNEIFQMAMLEPKLSILDETDSGLDIDALRIVAEGVNKLKTPENSTIVITHYQRLLDYIKPDVVHVLYKGRIVKTAGPELALELEEKGYDWIKKELGE